MNLRARLTLTSLLLVLLPLGILAYALEQRENRRAAAEAAARAELRFEAFEASWERVRQELDEKLNALEEVIRSDRPVRTALLSGASGDPTLVDAAARYAELAGFDVLYLLAKDGTILSSGHFRNEFGTKAERFAGSRADAFRNGAAVDLALADRTGRAWIAARPFSLSGRGFLLAGGFLLDELTLARLRPDPDTRVAWDTAPSAGAGRSDAGRDDAGRSDDARYFTRTFPLAWIDRDGVSDTRAMRVSWDSSTFTRTRAAARRNLLLTLGATGAGMLVLAFWFAGRISAPLRTLSDRASAFDLDRPAVSFEMDRNDEVGRLGRLLEDMKRRIVRNADAIRSAERRAATGDLARQVNHDLKNGLAPIRNIFRHLASLDPKDPEAIGRIWTERRASAEQSLAYLEELATNYERLRPDRAWRNCSLNDTIRSVLTGVPASPSLRVRATLDDSLPAIRASATDLRRIVENLARNAWESMRESGGTLSIETARADGDKTVLLRVRDEGPGMDDETAARVFEDFFTTKRTGTGLGLSIVRRLVTDHGGKIEFDTKPGAGTEFRVSFPAADSRTENT